MPSLATIYVIATTFIFSYTMGEKLSQSENYFQGMMSYLSEPTDVFILYNMILTIAIIAYRSLVWAFFGTTMEGEVVKITEKLKNKIVDLIILAYMIDLRFDFEMYVLVVFVVFTFILHNHLIFRSEYLVHVYSASTSLGLHYRALALYFLLFFLDYQILKFIFGNMLSSTKPTEGLFVYYMVINSFSLLEPFMQFAVDFYEKYTFQHIKNSDELIATISVFINIPRLVAELSLCVWLGWRLGLVFLAFIRGFEIVSNIKKTFDSFLRIKKLSQTMGLLKKIGGEQLDQFHDLTCTVCYEDMTEAVLLPCKHIFHEECIRQWIIKNLNHFCPKCKHELNFENTDLLYETIKTESPLDRMKNMTDPQDEDRQNPNSNHRIGQRHLDINQDTRFVRRPTQIQREEKDLVNEDVRHGSASLGRERREILVDGSGTASLGREIREVWVDRQGRTTPFKQYVIGRASLGEYPLQVYEAMKSKIMGVGAVPFGVPCAAVSNRGQPHMRRREQYVRQIQTIMRLLQMDRNVQMLLL